MQAFAQLLEALLFTASTLGKRRLMAAYFSERSDPERGYALAALCCTLVFAAAKPALIRELVGERVDPVLYSLSRDYVGDMAETVSLIWPDLPAPGQNYQPGLPEVVEMLATGKRARIKEELAVWMDALDATGRWALLKLVTGNIRIGVSARLAKLALADAFGVDVNEIEELWHGLEPPYLDLFAWLEGRGAKPALRDRAIFMPMMLSHPIEQDEFDALDLSQYQMELKWDGIRIQIVRTAQKVSLFSRTGDDISHTFPDLVAAILAIDEDSFVLDGELLAKEQGEIAPFNALQQRLNRKKVTAEMLRDYPAHVRLYDMLMDRGEDIRGLPLDLRRKHLETFHARHLSPLMDLSEIITAPTHERLAEIREKARSDARNGVEGLMIKKLASPYIAGRPRGHWFKWKRNTLTLDCVLMYAQRGSGKRSSFYSDYTFGVWQQGETDERKLVPVGKAYSGFTDQELVQIDKWVRGHTTQRFGPVREVPPHLVMEIEFDSIHSSSRHKSGLAMRFPRVHRIRWDKPADEADTIVSAQALAEHMPFST
jgi:DNA ligase-1